MSQRRASIEDAALQPSRHFSRMLRLNTLPPPKPMPSALLMSATVTELLRLAPPDARISEPMEPTEPAEPCRAAERAW
jgi:hypothetical protein